MIYKNYTPHIIRVQATNGDIIEYPSLGSARLDSALIPQPTPDDIPLWNRGPSTVLDLPPSEPDVYLIVSSVVKMYLPNRTDLIVPTSLDRRNGFCRGFWK